MATTWTVPVGNGSGVMEIVTEVAPLNVSTNLSQLIFDNSEEGFMNLHCPRENVTDTVICEYTPLMNMTDVVLPLGMCREDMPLYLICHAGWANITETVYGYVSPCLVLFTIITNTLMSVVLMKKNMRNPTNILLVAMALSDMFTGIWPVPCFLYFYTMKHFKDFVPFSWCLVHDMMTEFLPTIFHTASIWLTVALAVQRYIYVCHSLKAKQWCTIQNVVKVIVIIYVLAVLSQCTRFFEYTYIHVEAQSLRDSSRVIHTCMRDRAGFVQKFTHVYYSLYYGFRVIFIHLVPCTSLVVLNAMLIAAMRNAQIRREQLLRQNRRSECRRLKESNCTTLMLVAVVGLFLLVEFPLAILLILLILGNTFDLNLINNDDQTMASIIINLIILLSYPLNFFIYCGMSRQFRETFCRLFKPWKPPVNSENSQYISLVTENGGGRHQHTECETKDTVL